MKRSLIESIPVRLPSEIRAFISSSPIYDSSCSPEARVYFIDKGDGYYLKIGERSTLAREAQMTGYFHSLGLGVKVVAYLTEERDYMLTERAKGEDLTDARYLAEPKRLATEMGRLLRSLHERPFDRCPVNRIPEYLETVERNYKSGVFDDGLFGEKSSFVNADEAYAYVRENSWRLRSDVLIHGDFCLPNIMLDGWRFSKYIDVGNGGIGDRHIDIFWGAWTLNFNLGTDEYHDVFLDAYGRELVDPATLRVIEAAECFG